MDRQSCRWAALKHALIGLAIGVGVGAMAARGDCGGGRCGPQVAEAAAVSGVFGAALAAAFTLRF
jgi:hypothetical protein